MYIAILGRQPALGMAELERLHGTENTKWFSDESAVIDTGAFHFEQLGGSLKAGKVVMELNGNWGDTSRAIVEHYLKAWGISKGKVTLGISAYGFKATARDIQKTGIILKQQLKNNKVSLRLIPNSYPALNTATSHHNKLGLAPNKIELLAVRAGNGAIMVAESVGAQNITALAARDQARPHTDAFVGMLPPKLARIMVNLSGIKKGTILDPFCGTGVVLQEALLLGYDAHGADINPKMVNYASGNLEWLRKKYEHIWDYNHGVQLADATKDVWMSSQAVKDKNDNPFDAKLVPLRINAIVSEAYLGQPFSAPPKPEKLAEVRGNCNHIISEFLKNAAQQVKKGTPVVLAVPAWRDKQGNFTHLPLVNNLSKLGFERIKLSRVRNDELLYYRESQVVAREILILVKK